MRNLREKSALAAMVGVLAVACGERTNSELERFSTKTNFAAFGGLPTKTLTLTFDDGPRDHTLALAEYLQSEGIQGTFFINGIHATTVKRKVILKKMKAMGHVIANHTWDHGYPTITNVSSLDRFLVEQDLITDGMHLFRAPGGGWSTQLAGNLNATHLSKYVGPMWWDIGGGAHSSNWPYDADWSCDSRGVSWRTCADRYYSESVHRVNRGVVLFHDRIPTTLNMVRYLVQKWKAAGYRFVRIDEVPVIKEALKQTGTYRQGTSAICQDPDPTVFEIHGKRAWLNHGSYSARLSVDTQTARRTSYDHKFFVHHATDDQSNMAFNVLDGGAKLNGIRYNVSWSPGVEVPFHALWRCNRYEGKFKYGDGKFEDLTIRF